jgi:hypothetical protein
MNVSEAGKGEDGWGNPLDQQATARTMYEYCGGQQATGNMILIDAYKHEQGNLKHSWASTDTYLQLPSYRTQTFKKSHTGISRRSVPMKKVK